MTKVCLLIIQDLKSVVKRENMACHVFWSDINIRILVIRSSSIGRYPIFNFCEIDLFEKFKKSCVNQAVSLSTIL